jgi:tripartite-type tricarboxylate transporter receptor subunit TctC
VIARFTIALFFAVSMTGGASAQQAAIVTSYPSKAVKLVVPFPAGGPTDVWARVAADHLQKTLGKPFIVENQAAATGAVGTAFVARAPADGYTLLFTSNSGHVISPMLQNPRPFDGLKDFAPISMLLNYPFYLVVNASSQINTVADLVALAKAKPGQLNFGTFGIGSGSHLVAEMFNAQARIKTVNVTYRGIPGMQQALVTGDINYIFDSVGSSQPLVDAGKLRGLAVTGEERSPIVPNIPTLAESGFKGFNSVVWLGLLAPAGVPKPIVEKLSAEVERLVQTEALKKRIESYGYKPIGSTPDAFEAFIRAETPVWAEVIRANNIAPK